MKVFETKINKMSNFITTITFEAKVAWGQSSSAAVICAV
jgi:mevalonate kinase